MCDCYLRGTGESIPPPGGHHPGANISVSKTNAQEALSTVFWQVRGGLSPNPISHKTNKHKHTKSLRGHMQTRNLTKICLVSQELQEPRAKSKEQRAKSQEPGAKSQKTTAKSQEPRAKSQETITTQTQTQTQTHMHTQRHVCTHLRNTSKAEKTETDTQT